MCWVISVDRFFWVPKLPVAATATTVTLSTSSILNLGQLTRLKKSAVAATLLVGADQCCPEARKDKGQFRCKAEFAIPKCLALANLMADLMAGWWLRPTPRKNAGVSNSWDDDIPKRWKYIPNVPNHQAVIYHHIIII
jgi:hypothetical protein